MLNNGDRTYLKYRRPSRNEELCQVTHNFCCEIERAYERLPDDTLIPQAVVKDTIGETCKRYGTSKLREIGDEYSWGLDFPHPDAASFLSCARQFFGWRLEPSAADKSVCRKMEIIW